MSHLRLEVSLSLDLEELLRWRNLAQSQSKDFWTKVFDSEQAHEFISNFSKGFDDTPKEPSLFPRADVLQSDTELLVLIELPGLKKEDIRLQIADDKLVVKGTAPSPYPAHSKLSSERFYGSFERSIKLPVTVEREWASAKFANGLLQVRFPLDASVSTNTINIEED